VSGRRMVRAPLDSEQVTPWRTSGTVLITGGTGRLGAHVARLMAEAGAEHLLLASRRGRDAAGVAELETELTALGAKVSVAACDVSDHDAVRVLLESVPEHQPLTAVVHAAGVMQRIAPLTELSIDELAHVAAAKVAGAANLDELLAQTPLDAFVLFSSGAAVWGSAGQTGYAAANAYLDGLAARRRAQGLAATSIAWGSWDGGMVDAELSAGMRRLGAPPMRPELAIVALRQALDRREHHLVVADIKWPRFAPIYTMGRRRPLLDALPEVTALISGGPAGSDGPSILAERLAGLPAAQQSRVVLDLVRTHVAALLGQDGAEALEPGKAFSDLGFDSVAATDLKIRLSAATGLDLPATLVFDHATPAAVADYLLAELVPDRGGTKLLAALDRLEAALVALPTEEVEHHRVGARLRTLLGVVEAAAPGGGRIGEDATPDEVFDFIDNQLGLSS
jgi:NAD(P)-dependent dehydrogenase (short-subunit alcohol dehydrogenase family)/acyl carrier protein